MNNNEWHPSLVEPCSEPGTDIPNGFRDNVIESSQQSNK